MRTVAQTKLVIKQAAKLSAAAYAFAADKPTFWRTVAESQLTNLKRHSKGNAACFSGTYFEGETQQLWIGFAGTNDRQDWADNLSRATIPLRTGDNGNVHVGFARQFRSLRPAIDQAITEQTSLYGSGLEIIFVGHSLGSALATLGAVHYSDMGYHCRSIGFATPRLFDRKAAIYTDHICNTQITRVEIPTDWVCDVPPRNGKGGFCHVGRCLWIDANGGVTTEDRPTLRKAWMTVKRWTRRVWAWEVHQIDEYIRRIELWCDWSE